MDISFSRWTLAFAIIITLASTVFVLTHLGTPSFWHDEAFSGLLIRYSWDEMFTRIGADVHPPLYYVILRGWADVWNGGAYALRAFSYAFGLLTAGAMYGLIMAIYKRRDIAVLSVALFLTNSFVIQYLMEARMYTLGCFFLTLAGWLLIEAIERAGGPASVGCVARWLGFGVLAGLALLTHYYAGIFVIALGAYGVARMLREGFTTRGKRIAQGLLLSGVTATLLFLPWFRTFVFQVTQVTEGYWLTPVTWWSVPATLFKMMTGMDGRPELWWGQVGMVLVVALIAWSLWMSVRRASPLAHGDATASARALILPIVVIVPFILSILLSLKTSIYFYRYFIYALPFLLPAIIAGFASLNARALRTGSIMLLLAGSAVLFPLRWQALDITHKPGMRAVTTSLDARIAPNDRVIVGSSFALFTYRFHKTNTAQELLYSPNPLSHYSGTALLADGDTIASLDSVPSGAHVWSVDTSGFGNFQLPAPASWTLLSELRAPDMYDFRGDIILREWRVR